MATLHLGSPREWRWLASRNRVNVLDWAAGLILSAFGVLLVTVNLGRPPAVAPALAVLAMTLPVVWRRRWPVAMAVALGAGAALNCLVIGPMVRCGPALPALMLAAYALGRQPDRRPWWALALGLGALVFSAALQGFYDPQLDPGILALMAPMLVGLLAAGLLIETRSALVLQLRERNQELQRQRERIAQVAAEADRARIATDLDGWLASGIDGISGAARRGIGALRADDRDAARAAFETVGGEGRETLQHLRNVVGTLLQTDGPVEPAPTLRELDRLAPDPARVRIEVTGRRRALSPALELSGYRTLELLLAAFQPSHKRPVQVDVEYGSEALQLRVRGTAAAAAGEASALAAARTRVALYHGTVSTARQGTQSEVVARVPVGAVG